MQAAIAWADFLAKAERHAMGCIHATNDERQQLELVDWIGSRGGSVTASELSKNRRQFGRSVDEARNALDALVEAGYGRWEDTPPGPNGGRPTERFVLRSSPVTPSPVPETPRRSRANEGIDDSDPTKPSLNADGEPP